jgi:dsDNA-specific endonuclease/ATPase MutS2
MGFRNWLKGRKDADSGDEREKAVDTLSEEEDEIDPFNPFPEPISLEIGDVFDLHTIAPREVKRVVEAYLEEAHRAGFRSVRIIHGKGVGVQREMVRSILARTPFVAEWTDAPPQAGGLGATIVHFSDKAS